MFLVAASAVVAAMAIPLETALQQAYSNKSPTHHLRFKHISPKLASSSVAPLSAAAPQVQKELEWERMHPLPKIHIESEPSSLSSQFYKAWGERKSQALAGFLPTPESRLGTPPQVAFAHAPSPTDNWKAGSAAPGAMYQHSKDSSSDHAFTDGHGQKPVYDNSKEVRFRHPGQPVVPQRFAKSQNGKASALTYQHSQESGGGGDRAFTDGHGQKPVYDNSKEVRFRHRSVSGSLRKSGLGSHTGHHQTHHDTRHQTHHNTHHQTHHDTRHQTHHNTQLLSEFRFAKKNGHGAHGSSTGGGSSKGPLYSHSKNPVWHGWLQRQH